MVVNELLTPSEPAVIEISLNTVEIKEYTKEYNSLSNYLDDVYFGWFVLPTKDQKYDFHGILSEHITFIEDVNLATGEILVINEGKMGNWSQGIKEYYYNGEIIDREFVEDVKKEEVIKQIVKVGVNPNKFTSDVSNPKNIKWIDYKLSEVELDENGDFVYDENHEVKFKTIDVKIPDLNHYFKENVKKFSSIAFDDYQLDAISEIIFRSDSEYKLDEEFFCDNANEGDLYGERRLKGKYFNSLLTKQQFYKKLFLVNNAKDIENNYYQNGFKFNEDDFEFEAIVRPDIELLVESKPQLDNQPLFTKETVINSSIEKKSKH